MPKADIPNRARPPKVRQKRGPGRPRARADLSLSKSDIVHRALDLCRIESLHSVSIVRVANKLQVTPALIHYYVGGRDRLTSGVMNAFYTALVAGLPAPEQDWRADLTGVFDTIYEFYIQFSGVTAYLMSHNRFRVFQLVDTGERDYGALFFERVIGSVRIAGLSAQATAMYSHLLLQHVLSSAYQQASRQLPEDHQDFLISRGKQLASREAPNTVFVLDDFAALRGHDAFRAGLDIIADAIAREQKSRAAAPRPRARR